MLYKAVSISITILLVTMSSYNVYAQTPTNIKLLKTFGYLDSEQHFVVVGEVENQGTPVQFVQVTAQFFDKELKPLTSMSGSIGIENLSSGQISPFEIVLKDEKLASLVKSFTVSIGNFNKAEEKPKKLDVIFHNLVTSGDTVTVSGRIANDGTQLSLNTKAMVVLYNAVGEPVRYAFTFTDPRNIFPASSGIFSLKINGEKIGTIAGYAIYSESSQYSETNRLLKMQSVESGKMQRLKETVDLMGLNGLNQKNQRTSSVNVGEPLLLTVSVANSALERQQYMYILQIKDQNGFVVSLSWVINFLDARASGRSTIAWVPLERGTYTVEAFIWKSVDEAVPLSFKTLSMAFSVT